MPVVVPASKTDIALASSTAGALPVSAGPGSIPVANDRLTFLQGCLTGRLAAGFNVAREFVHDDAPSTWSERWSPTIFEGDDSLTPDCVRSRGVHAGDNGPGQPSMTWNEESRFVNGAPPGGLWEGHYNYGSFDGTTSYRPLVYYIDQNDHLFYHEERIGLFVLYGKDASIPLLSVDTGGNNSGRVRIENAGSASPLEVVGTEGNIDFQLNSGQHLRLATVQAADAVNTTRDGIGIAMNGAYWTGSASAGAAASIQTIVTGNNAFHSLWSVGTSDFAWKNDAKLGLNVPLAKLTQNLVMRRGYFAVIDDFDQGPYSLIGLNVASNSTNHVGIDPDAIGTVFGGNLHFGAYGTGAGPRIRSGAGGVDNYVVLNAGSAGSNSNIVYINLDSQSARIDAYGQCNVYANGAAGRCLSVGTGSPTGILFSGVGSAHYGIRCTGTIGLFELMAAPGDDPRAWTATTASLAVPGYVQAGSSFKVGSTQVIGAQGAAVADATDATTVITQLNSLLSRLRAHGLIAA